MEATRFEALFSQQDVDMVLISSDYNRFYLSGFTGSTATLVITKKSKAILTDFRYLNQAASECPGYEVIDVKNESLHHFVNRLVNTENIKSIGFEGDFVTYDMFKQLEKNIEAPLKSIDLKALRAIKTEEEISIMQKACEIVDDTFAYMLKNVKVGMREKEVEQMLVSHMKSLGASAESFTTIVASGVRGAMPHGIASDKVIAANELVTLDFGAIYKGYCSDITRTFATGRDIDPKLLEIYGIVKQAQETALDAIRPGVCCKDIDKVARDIISNAGYGAYFGHGLGHGLGIQVHEYPNFNPLCDVNLASGMVMTVEPGIYIDGLGGVRIEDDVVVTDSGYLVLTKASKELKYLEN